MQHISPKLLSPCQGPACLILPPPGMSFNYGQKCCEKKPIRKKLPPFILLGLMLRVFWKQFYRNLILVPVLVFSHPLPLPWVGATDFSPSRAVTSLPPRLMRFGRFWFFGGECEGGGSYIVVTPKQSQGNPQQLHQQLPGCKICSSRSEAGAQLFHGSLILFQGGRRRGGLGVVVVVVEISLVARMWVPEQQSNFILTFSPSSFPFQMHIRFYFTGELNALLTAEITNLIWNWGF